MMKQCLFITFCALFCVAVTAQTTLKIGVLNASNNWWLAVTDIDAGATTKTIEMQQGSDGEWVTMHTDYNPYWRYWTYQSMTGQPFNFPLSFRLTSEDGKQLTILSTIVSFTGSEQIIDTNAQYGSTPVEATAAPVEPTSAPVQPTEAPVEPTQAPVDPTSAPVQPTEAPVEPTQAPVDPTSAPAEPTEAQTSSDEDIGSEDYCNGAVDDSETLEDPTNAPAVPDTIPTKAPYNQGGYPSGNNGYSRPTSEPVQPTSAPVQPTSAPVQPTSAPAQPTKAPATVKAATSAPATSKAATTAPSTGSGCSAPMKLMVPLYTYPGATWDTVIANAKLVPTVVIINPSNGPGSKVDSKFTQYIKKMTDAGIEVIGYVYTSYGARSAATVKKDIDFYASEYPGVTGIFLDEVSTSTSQLSYYKDLHTYVMAMPGYKYNVINPGAVPNQGYMDASTQIVSFESSGSSSIGNPSFATCDNKEHFSAIAYGISSSQINSYIDTLFSKKYFGYVYATSTGLTGGTYNSLPSYYASMVSYIAQKNSA